MTNNKFFPRPFPDPSVPAYGNMAAALLDAFESGRIHFTNDPDHFCSHIAFRNSYQSFTIYLSYLFAIIRSYPGYSRHSDDRIEEVLRDDNIIDEDYISYEFGLLHELEEAEDIDEAIIGVFIGNLYNEAVPYSPDQIKYYPHTLD